MSISTQITVAATAETIIITAPGALRGPMGDVTPEVTALVERAELGAAQAGVSAGQASSSAAQAGGSAAESASSAGNASGSAAAAEGNAIAAEASKAAAEVSESAAEQSATDAASSAAAAGDSASQAGNSASSSAQSAAAASDSETAAGSSASSAQASASSATGSASASSSSASAAQDSADEAQTSASAAGQSATEAAQSATSAQEDADAAAARVARFLAPSAVEPTQRDNGQPLQVGDQWPKTTDGKVYSWTGSSWVALNSSAQQLEEKLASNALETDGAANIGLFGDVRKLDIILRDQIFPGVISGFVTTSSRGIVSVDINDDKSTELQLLFNTCANVEIDTQISVNNTVTVSTPGSNVKCSPSGILLNGPGMSQKTMLKITGEGSDLCLMDMDNPLMLKSTTGGRQTAINIQADNVTVRFSRFRRMLHSVITDANGEWLGSQYLFNYAYDCLGVGAGASDDGSTNFGENRGDAFLIWGASGKMIGNTAVCGEGQDARAAFHCESLGSEFHTRPPNPARDGSDYLMTHNSALGPFRRHFVFENTKRGLMDANNSLGGATWWPLAIIGGSDNTARQTKILYTRPSTNTAGAAWAPNRAGIMIGMSGVRNKIKGAEIVFSSDAVGDGLSSLLSALTSQGTELEDIRVLKPVGAGGNGFVVDRHPDLKARNLYIENAATGYTTFGTFDGTFENCSGKNLSANDFSCQGGTNSTVRIKGGRTDGAVRAALVSNTANFEMTGHTTKNISGNDIEVFNISGNATIHSNKNEDGTGKIVGFSPPFTSTQDRNIGDNPGYSYNLKYTLASITNIASVLNTKGKYSGRMVVCQEDGLVYIATGSAPNAPWAKGSTLVTPA